MATERNNFCRVFELPEEYPQGFLFDGGKPVTFTIVDWFNPMPSGDLLAPWAEIIPKLESFLKAKPYIKHGKKYILITDFGTSMVFEGDRQSADKA